MTNQPVEKVFSTDHPYYKESHEFFLKTIEHLKKEIPEELKEEELEFGPSMLDTIMRNICVFAVEHLKKELTGPDLAFIIQRQRASGFFRELTLAERLASEGFVISGAENDEDGQLDN